MVYLASEVKKISDAVHLGLCGVDLIIAGDISKPIGSECQATMIEINAAPSLRIHHYPSAGGYPRNVSGAILDEILRRRKGSTEQLITSDRQSTFAKKIIDPNSYIPISEGEKKYYEKVID